MCFEVYIKSISQLINVKKLCSTDAKTIKGCSAFGPLTFRCILTIDN